MDSSYRFTGGARELWRCIQAGELGRVFSLELVFHNAYGPDKPWCFDPRLSGGTLMDLGEHLIEGSMGRKEKDGAPANRDAHVESFSQVSVACGGLKPGLDRVRRFVSQREGWIAGRGIECPGFDP